METSGAPCRGHELGAKAKAFCESWEVVRLGCHGSVGRSLGAQEQATSWRAGFVRN